MTLTGTRHGMPTLQFNSTLAGGPCRGFPRIVRAGFSESAPPSSRATVHSHPTTVHPTRSPYSHQTAAQPRNRVRNAQRAPSLHSPHPFTANACVRLPSWRGQLALVLVRRMGALSMSTSSPNAVPS